ncbi:MAG: cupredoxin domain-containing protein [Candidatus Binataceae bacterium]
MRYFGKNLGLTLIMLAMLGAGGAAHAEARILEVRFENHHFIPETVTVPAGQALVVRVVNADNETIEFESFKLNREKAISPGETITVHDGTGRPVGVRGLSLRDRASRNDRARN